MKLGETVFAAGLLALMFLLLVQIFIPGLRLWNLSQSLSEARTKGMIAHQRISADLRATHSSSLTEVQDANLSAISMLSVERPGGFDPSTGQPIWRQIVAYYLKNKELYRVTWKPGDQPALSRTLPTTLPFALSPAELRQLCNTGRGRFLCRGGQNLNVTLQAPRSYDLTFDVEALTQKGVILCKRQSRVVTLNG